jgi:hypothetical protein
MRGHTTIMRIRSEGKAPPLVFVNDYPCKTDWFEHAEHAMVCTDGDSLSSMDFRFLTGLRVSVSATSEARARALFDRIKAAGATAVAAVHVQQDRHSSDQSGWCEVFNLENSNG